MIKKIELSTMYTPYTLDTYNTFTYDQAEINYIDYYNEEHDTECDYDDFEWEYDMQGYIKALADNYITLLNAEILDEVIKKVEYNGKVYSPREYNFKTDDADPIFTVDHDKLVQYINEHREDYDKNKIGSCDGFIWLGDEDDTMLNYYLATVSEKIYSRDSYFYDQNEIYPQEYITMTPIKKEKTCHYDTCNNPPSCNLH